MKKTLIIVLTTLGISYSWVGTYKVIKVERGNFIKTYTLVNIVTGKVRFKNLTNANKITRYESPLYIDVGDTVIASGFPHFERFEKLR